METNPGVGGASGLNGSLLLLSVDGGQVAAGAEGAQGNLSPELKKGGAPAGSDHESLVAAAQILSTEKLKQQLTGTATSDDKKILEVIAIGS